MKEKIMEILQEINEEIASASEDVNLIEEGLIDSFDIVTLIAELEEAFNVEIDGEAITEENFSSVNQIEKIICASKKQS